MKFLHQHSINIDPKLILRIGLAGVLIYAGISLVKSPSLWQGFVPPWLQSLVDVNTFLLVHGIFEIALGLGLLLGLFVPLLSLITFLDFLSIIVFFGIDPVTFRDFGLLMAALALFLLSTNKERASKINSREVGS